MKKGKGLKDPESKAAMEIVVFEQRQDAMVELMKGAKEKAISVVFREAGSIETLNFTRAQAEFFMLVKLKRMKETKEYREKLDMTWPQFCESVGVDWRATDRKLDDLKGLKAEFLQSFVNFSGFEFNKIKYLAEEKFTNLVKIQGNTIIYDGQEIAISPENKDEIQSVLERIEAKYKEDLENAQAEIGGHKKIIKQKNTLLEKNATELTKWERRAKGKGLSPEEDAFNEQLDEIRTQFTGYITRIEPGKIEELNGDQEKVTVDMRAGYLALMEWMFMRVKAARDTAEERFGGDLKEADWKPGK